MPACRNGFPVLLGILSLAGLYAISRYSFLLFHCLAEAFSIVIAIAVFAVFWNTRRFVTNGLFLVIGFGCLFAGSLDLIYIFAYQGMSVFPCSDGNLALQGKTIAQWYVSLSCLGSFLFLRRRLNQNLVLLVYSALAVLALLTIFYWRIFPDCYREGEGTTSFETFGLVISCGAYLGTLILLVRRRSEFDGYVFKLLAATLIAFLVEDSACALATELNGPARTIAHLCQMIALYFVYKAFVEVGLSKPFDLLFRSQQQSAEGLRLVLEASGTGWWRLDLVKGTLTTDDRCKALFGLPSTTEPSFELFLERITPQGRPIAQQHVAEATARPADLAADYRTLWPDGSEHWIFIKGRSYHDAPGRPCCFEGITMDITDRKRAEQALSESISRLQATLESTADGILVVDLEGRIVDFNERFLAMWRFSQEFIAAGRKRDPVAAPDEHRAMRLALDQLKDPDGFVAKVRELYAAPEASSFDVLEWKDGRVFERYSQPQRINGRPVGRVWSFRDVTDRRAAQEILRQAHEEQLQKHRADLAHVARLSMMGEMAASLAHELNQPLHAVNNYARGSLRRLSKTPHRDEQLVAALEQIGAEANRAAGIVRRVRGFIQKREPQFSDVLVNNLVEDVILLDKAELEQRHTRVATELAADLPAVIGDPVQIEQVVMNLLRNGLEAMDEIPEWQRLLRITTMRNGADLVQVDVCDRGGGIGGEDLEKIFEAFFTTKPEGMGMGLAISRSIILAHGGHLWATINPDQGCTFHFTLPVGKRN
jgi:PAS domain S-box-containing protein